MARITDNEIQLIDLVKKDATEVVDTLGELQYQKISIELQIDREITKIKDIKKREDTIFEDLKSKYGDVTINIETGEIS